MSIDAIYDKIKNWNCEDVRDLQEMLRSVSDEVIVADDPFEAQAYAEQKWDEIGDNLPIADEYEERVMKHSSYPIWTCDKDGYCLTGVVADTIEHITEIEQNYYLNLSLRYNNNGGNLLWVLVLKSILLIRESICINIMTVTNYLQSFEMH